MRRTYNDMPQKRTIPGYFDEIDGFSKTYFGKPEEAKPDIQVTVPDESIENPTAPDKKGQVMKEKREIVRKKKGGSSPKITNASRAFISGDLNLMLGLYKMRERHFRNKSRTNGQILEDAFLYYIKQHDREAYDEFVSKGLIR